MGHALSKKAILHLKMATVRFDLNIAVCCLTLRRNKQFSNVFVGKPSLRNANLKFCMENCIFRVKTGDFWAFSNGCCPKKTFNIAKVS